MRDPIHSVLGWVYVVRNDEHKEGIVKIGQTKTSVAERIAGLNSTGVLGTFRLIEAFPVIDVFGAEKMLHAELKDRQYVNGSNREFFMYSPIPDLVMECRRLLLANGFLLQLAENDVPRLNITLLPMTQTAELSRPEKVVIGAVISLCRSLESDSWSGTAADLLPVIKRFGNVPTSVRVLAKCLNKAWIDICTAVPAAKRIGHAGMMYYTFKRLENGDCGSTHALEKANSRQVSETESPISPIQPNLAEAGAPTLTTTVI